MSLPWFRSRLLVRRQLDRMFLDFADKLFRHMSGCGDWPPYSLRCFVGGAWDFGRAGGAFVEQCWGLGLFRPQIRILDIGCGCGRVARALARERRLQEIQCSYTGMDVDRISVEWCQRHIAALDERFSFYHADCLNRSYNPHGSLAAEDYAFPHPDASFDLILLTSVMTHLLERDVYHYLSEASRMLAPGGVVYASFFLYEPIQGAIGGAPRHGIRFPLVQGNYAVNREDYPTNAVAYREAYIRRIIAEVGLEAVGPTRYGLQDVLLLTKAPGTWPEPQLERGWHRLQDGCWRWTERMFSVRLRRPAPGPMALRFRFHLPDAIVSELKEVRLSAHIDGVPLGSTEYRAAGDQLYCCEIPASRWVDETVLVQFELDKALEPSPVDLRQLGVIVVFQECAGPLKRRLEPFVLCQ